MHEYIFSRLSADKAVALSVVKPLYCSLFHCVIGVPSIDLRCDGSRNYKGKLKLLKA